MPFIVMNTEGKYLTNRLPTGKMYMNRSKYVEDIDKAKIFTTKGAATRSGNYQYDEFSVIEVSLVIKDADNVP